MPATKCHPPAYTRPVLDALLGILRHLVPLGLPLAVAWTFYLANVLLARWFADRDARLLPRVLRAGTFTIVVCAGVPAGADAVTLCLEHRETLGVCFVGEIESEKQWSSALDLQMDTAWSSVRVIPASACGALRGEDLAVRGWSPTPVTDLGYFDVDHPVKSALATPGNWYWSTRDGDYDLKKLLDLGRCRLLIDGYDG